jgi:holo-[acyl-carrier protein] synthase
MIFGIGTDIVEKKRIEKLLHEFGERFWKRILTPTEQQTFLQKKELAQSSFLAKRFAAKEAISKALGTGIAQGVSFQDIEINNDALGKPIAQLFGTAQQIAQQHQIKKVHLSLSDEHSMIVAFSVLEI